MKIIDGINGAPTSLSFNLECATAITGKGRQLISVATVAFDMFIGHNVYYLDLDDCIMYIKNVDNEVRKYKDEDVLDNNISRKKICELLRSRFINKKDYDDNRLFIERIVNNLSIESANRLYYKSNIFEFCRNSKIKQLIYKMVTEEEIYVTPTRENTPDNLLVYLDKFWDYLEEFVFYNHEVIDREYRVTHLDRRAVLVIDTDSNMIDTHPWIEFVKNEIMPEDELKTKNNIDFDCVCVYTLCFQLQNMIRIALATYLRQCNVKEEVIPILDMKNEYLYKRMLITPVKKSYAATTLYKEGKFMNYKLDAKGLQIKKSDTNRIVSKQFTKILEEDILGVENVSLIDILIKVKEIEKTIRESLNNGESTYLKPCNMKDIEAYKDPLSNQGFRGLMVWNELYPESQIVLPDHFFLVKLLVHKPSDLDKIQDIKVRNVIENLIFNNPEKRIKSKGLYVLAIPRDTSIPEWAIPCINVEGILQDTMKAFMNVILALGPDKIYMDSNSNRFSNIIAL